MKETPAPVTLDELAAELRRIRELLETPAPRPDDLVGPEYVAARTGLSLRSICDGKAGTGAIPRVTLKQPGATRSLVRFPRRAVDHWLAKLVRQAEAATTQGHVADFLRRQRQRKRQKGDRAA